MIFNLRKREVKNWASWLLTTEEGTSSRDVVKMGVLSRDILSKAYPSWRNTSPFRLSRDPSYLLTHLWEAEGLAPPGTVLCPSSACLAPGYLRR